MDRLATRKDALNRTEGYAYDLNGNLNVFTDRKQQVSTFLYDAVNRRSSAVFADGSSTSFTYDAVGRLAQVTDSVSGTIQFLYDNLDRLTQEITPQGAVAYEYDALGRRTKMTVSGLAPVTYQYDAASRLTQVAWGSFVVTIAYDAAGRRTSLTYSNGATTTYTYDAASRLTSITHTGPLGLIESLTYAYDAGGNRILLTRANGPAILLSDPVQATYDAANQLIQFNGNPVTHDANGNLTSDGVNTYTWDARNRLIARSGPGLSESFQYDALGHRTSKTINGQTTQFLYDGNDIIAEMQGGAITAFYLRGLNIDEPFIRITPTGNEYYHTDALGSTLALTNDAGAVTTTYVYEPFGRTQITGTSSNPFQYSGRENDSTGLYYYRARYYSPTIARFVSPDRIGFLGGDINLYAYVRNNPVRFSDPFGLFVGEAFTRGLNVLLNSGKSAEEIGVIGRAIDAVVGAGATAAGIEVPPNIRNSEVPLVGGTIGNTLDVLSLAGSIQTAGLADGIAFAGVANNPVAAPVFAIVLAGLSGYEAGTAINNLVLNKIPGGNPVEQAFELVLGRRK